MPRKERRAGGVGVGEDGRAGSTGKSSPTVEKVAGELTGSGKRAPTTPGSTSIGREKNENGKKGS
jgi:hypothetical protein